jgi:carbamoyl-phosphate synthase large subunit
MKSTGEVMGIDRNFERAYAKSQIAEGSVLPEGGTLFVSVKDSDKPHIIDPVRDLAARGFKLIATGGTQRFLSEAGLKVERINKVAEGRPHIVDRIVDGDIALIFNTTEGWQSHKDSQSIRTAALQMKVPYYTTAAASAAAALAITSVRVSELAVRPLQAYYS